MFRIVYLCLLGTFKFIYGEWNFHNCTYDVKNSVANCSFMGYTDIPGNLPPNVTVLDLTGNHVESVRRNALDKYRFLEVLSLTYNAISWIDDDAFYSLNRLRILSLTGNQLQHNNYSDHAFRGLNNLRELYLNKNLNPPSPFSLSCKETSCNYSNKAFSYLVNLRILSIDLCGKSEFGRGFLQLVHLEKLSFDYCLACTLYNKTFENFRNSNITELNLSHCLLYTVSETIESGILNPFPKVTSLDLSNSYFSLKHALQLLNVYTNKTMDLINFHGVSRASRDSQSNPYWIKITQDMMKYLRTICVKTLILSYNGIMGTEPKALFNYEHPECFENIILSANRFTLGYYALYLEFIILLSRLSNLVLFDYSYVPIQFENMKFILPPNLHVPSDDMITSERHMLTASKITFSLPTKLRTLRFSHIMHMTTINRISLEIRNTTNLKHFDLSYIEFYRFPEITMPDGHSIQYFDFSGIDANVFVDKGVAKLMRDVNTVVLQYVNLDLACRTGKDVFRYFRNNTEVIDISHNHLEDLPGSFIQLTNLRKLNLSHNSFRQFPKVLLGLTNMLLLDLRVNQLLTLDKHTTSWIERLHNRNKNFTLYLAGNEFSCVCDYMSFIDWLSRTAVTLDNARNYSCNFPNGTRVSIHQVIQRYHQTFSDCNAIAWLRIGVICIVSSFILIGITAVAYQFRWRLTYFLYRQLKSKYTEGDSNELGFTYDVFVAYANDCTEWLVGSLIPMLEQDWHLSVCIKDRDFPIGADRGDTVIQSIRFSEYVIFILTPGFINRKWGRFEIEMAKYEMFEQRSRKDIIVVLKDGVTKEQVPPEFAAIWRKIRLIEWHQNRLDPENFWYDLKMQLNVL